MTPFMANLERPLIQARVQATFISSIVLPLWSRVHDLLHDLDEPLDNIHTTRAIFEDQVAALEEEGDAACA